MTTESKSEHHLMQFFSFSHLPEHLQDVSSRFYSLAEYIQTALPFGSEQTTALRKLLEAKDCAVRARIQK